MNLHLTHRDGVPLYLQIINQIKQLISSGRLAVDQELLPIRVLAQKLVINPNTVARAYRELESTGWVYKRRGSGTFVSDKTTSLSVDICQKQIKDVVRSLLAEAGHMNISTDQIIKLVREVDEEQQLANSSDKQPAPGKEGKNKS